MIDPHMEQDRIGWAPVSTAPQGPRWQYAELAFGTKSTRIYDVLAWLVLAAACLLVCATFRDYGVTWDGQGEAVYGTLLLKYYASGFQDRSAFEFVNCRFYGGGFEIPAALLARIAPFRPHETRHLLSGLIGIVGLAGTWRVARAIGGARAGALAALLLLGIPSWYGQMFVNARDVPFASGMVFCLLATLRAIDELPRLRWSTRILFGLALGLTLSVRVGGVLALLFLLAPIALWLIARARAGADRAELARDAGRIAGSLAPALAIAYLVMVALWPWAIDSPLNPLRALILFSSFPFDASVLVDGELVPAMHLPASYLPQQLAVRLPELVLVGVAAALIAAGLRLLRRSGAPSLRIATVVLAAFFPIAYSMLARPVDYNGLRHFLFVLPPLSVLAALAYDRALLAAPARALRSGLALALALAGLVQTRATIALHPDEYVYFNRLVGGPRGAQGRFELDYWGISLAEASRRLADHLTQHHDLPKPGQSAFKVYVCGSAWSAATFFPPWLSPVERIEDADFQIAIAQHYCKHVPGGRRMLGVVRAGALLSFVEDLRSGAEPEPNARERSRPEAPVARPSRANPS